MPSGARALHCYRVIKPLGFDGRFGHRQESPLTKQLQYRPDIDGLRAVAVLAVVAFHAFPSLLPGGFVGVDIFFAISGYLIGYIVLTEVASGRFSYMGFYARRCRRLFPALSLVLTVCYLIGWQTLFADEFKRLADDISATCAFVLNLVLLHQSGYFDVAAEAKPLLHLWSLSVEEQFYFACPLAIWLAWRSRVDVRLVLVTTVVLSFALNILTTWTDQPLAFFSPLTRIWELALGCLLAASKLHAPARSPCLSALWQQVLGVGLIAFGVAFTDSSSFPGWWALLPVAGALAVIDAGPATPVSRALSRKPAVFIGLISYPLYLWHWPLLSFASIIQGGIVSTTERLTLIGASFVLAFVTHRWIELPIRHGVTWQRAKTIGVIAVIVCCGSVGYLTFRSAGYPSRDIASINASVASDLRVPEGSRRSDGSCRALLGSNEPDGVTCIVHGSSPRIMIFGDSHAMALNSAVFAGLVNLDTALVATHQHLWSTAECMKPADPAIWLALPDTCAAVVRSVLTILTKMPSIDTVLFAFSDSHRYGNHDKFYFNAGRIKAIQNEIVSNGHNVVHVIDVPTFRMAPQACAPRRIPMFGAVLKAGVCREERSQIEQDQSELREYIASLVGPYVTTYDSLDAMCDASTCYAATTAGLSTGDRDISTNAAA
jgi:peptidoglycan/LPS O-acetylase OafA/YrhL